MIKKVYMTYSEDDPAFIGVFKRIKCQFIEKEKSLLSRFGEKS